MAVKFHKILFFLWNSKIISKHRLWYRREPFFQMKKQSFCGMYVKCVRFNFTLHTVHSKYSRTKWKYLLTISNNMLIINIGEKAHAGNATHNVHPPLMQKTRIHIQPHTLHHSLIYYLKLRKRHTKCKGEVRITVLVLIKLTQFAVALRLRCGSCKLIFWHYFIIFR